MVCQKLYQDNVSRWGSLEESNSLFLFCTLKNAVLAAILGRQCSVGVPCFFLVLVLILSVHVQKTHICRSQTAERITSLMHEKRIANTPCGSLIWLYIKSQFGKIKSSINRPLYNAILNHQSSKQKGRKDLTLTTPPKVTFGR